MLLQDARYYLLNDSRKNLRAVYFRSESRQLAQKCEALQGQLQQLNSQLAHEADTHQASGHAQQ
jgi:uncharacterized protein YukE